MTRVGWSFLALTVAFTVVGQLLVKQGMLQTGAGPDEVAMLPRFVWRAFTNRYVVAGLACAVAAAGCWTVAVARADLSLAYPFMGLAIVLVLTLSATIFGEAVPRHRWLGVLLVCVGLVVAARD